MLEFINAARKELADIFLEFAYRDDLQHMPIEKDNALNHPRNQFPINLTPTLELNGISIEAITFIDEEVKNEPVQLELFPE